MLVGFEIEVAGIDRTALRAQVRGSVNSRFTLHFHDDGSIRRNNYGIADVSIIPVTDMLLPAGAQRIDTYGPEIVTDPLSGADAMELASELGEVLYKIPDNSRASIHVHFSGFQGWQHIQRLIRLMYMLEAPLYRVAALGSRHRGELMYNGSPNDYRYCRPLSYPIFVLNPVNGKLVPLINIKKVLGAESFAEMLYGWGRLDYFWNDGELAHYCPHRLHSINLASLIRHRTVELRLWNGTTRYIPDVIALSIRLFEMARDGYEELTPMPLGSKPEFTAEDFKAFVGMDVKHLWGKRWPTAPTVNLMSHYSQHNEMISPSRPLYSCTWENE